MIIWGAKHLEKWWKGHETSQNCKYPWKVCFGTQKRTWIMFTTKPLKKWSKTKYKKWRIYTMRTNQHEAAWQAPPPTSKKASPVINIKGDTPKKRKEADTNLDTTAPFFNKRISNTLPINSGPFTSEELKKCTAKLQNAKTPGPDFIPANENLHCLTTHCLSSATKQKPATNQKPYHCRPFCLCRKKETFHCPQTIVELHCPRLPQKSTT